MENDRDSLTDMDWSLPEFVPEQIALYQTDHLITQPVCRFDPAEAVRQVCSARR